MSYRQNQVLAPCNLDPFMTIVWVETYIDIVRRGGMPVWAEMNADAMVEYYTELENE